MGGCLSTPAPAAPPLPQWKDDLVQSHEAQLVAALATLRGRSDTAGARRPQGDQQHALQQQGQDIGQPQRHPPPLAPAPQQQRHARHGSSAHVQQQANLQDAPGALQTSQPPAPAPDCSIAPPQQRAFSIDVLAKMQQMQQQLALVNSTPALGLMEAAELLVRRLDVALVRCGHVQGPRRGGEGALPQWQAGGSQSSAT